MALLDHNRPQVTQALARFFGIKGQPSSAIDSNVSPVIAVGDANDSPYLRHAIPVGAGAAGAAVVGELGFLIVRPGPNVALQIKALRMSTPAAAAQTCSIRALTAADVATLGIASSVQLMDLSNPDDVWGLRSSAISFGSHNANLGTELDVMAGAAASTDEIHLPDPGIILYGQGAQATIDASAALAIVGTTFNQAMRGAFYGREWPLPG